MDLGFWMLVFAVLALSFLFSGMEAGVAALSRVRIRNLMHHGNESAAVLHRFLENPENFLWTILIGNTLANFTAVALIVSKLYDHATGNIWVFGAGVLLTAVVIYSGFDLLPKLLFRQFPNRLCVRLAKPFRAIHFLLAPLVNVLSGLSRTLLRWTDGRAFTGQMFGNREEIRFLMQEAAHNFTTDERTMIARVMDLQGVTLRQIAVPMANVFAVPETSPMSTVLRVSRESGFSRLPVWRQEGSRRRIVGVIPVTKLLLAAEIDPARAAANYVKPALYLEEDLRLEVALQRLQRSGNRIAIVLGPDKSERGIVSLQDLLRFIFGEVSL
jgi:CBS domain containing-hemolysin-like protein